MLRKIPRKGALAGFVALGLADLQLYAHRFHPPTEMLGRFCASSSFRTGLQNLLQEVRIVPTCGPVWKRLCKV